MTSRFVAAGTDQKPAPVHDDWAKAKEEVDSARMAKSVTKGKQEDGKSLYEVLQANKAAKQEAFEEAAKLRNQFRALDDSEVAFLESVQESEREKEMAARQETAEQLEVFRRQQMAAEQASLKAAQSKSQAASKLDEEAASPWTSTRKRRRNEKVDETAPTSKYQKASMNDKNGVVSAPVPDASIKELETTTDDAEKQSPASIATAEEPKAQPSVSKITSLGLDAYDSDDSDD